MRFIEKKDKNDILSFVPLIKLDYSKWHIVNLKFQADTDDERRAIMDKFVAINDDKEGFVFLEDDSNAIAIIQLGEVDSYSALKSNIENNLKDKRCRVLARKMTANGMKQIQINLSENLSPEEHVSHLMYEQREQRIENVIMIADDDMFVRKTLSASLSAVSVLHEAEDGADVVEKYVECNPDILILDIHMPNKDGLTLTKEVIAQDPDAFIIVSSSDSVKDNVLLAVQRGAVGFLAKPIQKDKLSKYLEQCITFKS